MRSPLTRIRFMLDHRWSRARMSRYVDADLAPAERARIERHVRDCADCRGLLASLRTMLSALAGLPETRTESVAGSVLAGVHERLAQGDDERA